MDGLTCAVCKRSDAGVTMQVGEHQVCMNCNPFRRCPKCLGTFKTASTPNDMGRQKCDGCGATRRR
jgi:hypothetical protein